MWFEKITRKLSSFSSKRNNFAPDVQGEPPFSKHLYACTPHNNLRSTMKRVVFILGLAGLLLLGGLFAKRRYYDPHHRLDNANSQVDMLKKSSNVQNGDIIFQSSLSGQSKAIQLATKSKYSHCGIIYKDGGDYFVFEALQPVRHTPLAQWIARGQDGKYVIKRLKNAEKILTPTTLAEMKKIGEQFNGKNYDMTFEWSDDKIYCSELIWKIYKWATGLEVGKLQKLGDFDLSHDIVKKILYERYGATIPKNETVISPAAIFNSELLTTVQAN